MPVSLQEEVLGFAQTRILENKRNESAVTEELVSVAERFFLLEYDDLLVKPSCVHLNYLLPNSPAIQQMPVYL